MFVGEYQHTLDSKGRVSLPAKFRSKLTGSVTVAKGLDNALYVFPPEEYERFTAGLLEKADFDPRVRGLRRYFMSGADEVDLDSAGRISLPPHLRDHANLSKDVAVIGNGSRIEMWDAAAWAEYNGATAENVEDLAQELAAAGLL
jgi:MraZ protein